MITRWLVAAGAALILVVPAAGNASEWIGTWGAAPEPPRLAAGRFPATPSYDNQTIREVVRIAAGGHRFRVRFTNAYGT
jgi:hypothetical protein